MRRRWVISIVVAVAVLLAVAVGYRAITSTSTSAPPRGPRAALITLLRGRQVYFTSVTCIRNGRTFRGAAVTRCNVNFGNPHIQAYCLANLQGRWVDRYRNRPIPCRPDWKGFHITIIS